MNLVINIVICTSIIFFNTGILNSLPKSITLDKPLKGFLIGSYLEYFEDTQGSLSFENILSEKYASQWKSSGRDTLGFGFSKSVYWVRLVIENPSSRPAEILLMQGYPLIDSLNFYEPNNGSYRAIETGDYKPFSSRAYNHRNFVFPIHVKEHYRGVYYFRFASTSSMNIILRIWSPEEFKEHAFFEHGILMFFYGIIIIMILYNLFVYFFIRRKESLLYVAFLTCFLFFLLDLYGYGFQFLWPNHSWWTNFSLPLFLSLTVFFELLFFSEFIDLKIVDKRGYLVNRILIYGNILLIISSLFGPYRWVMAISSLFTGLVVITQLVMTVVYCLKKYRAAFFWISAFGSLFITSTIFLFKTLGVLSTNFITEWSHYIGLSITVIILSAAMGDRINIMSRELGDLTVSLEKKTSIISSMLDFANKINSLEDLDEICDYILMTIKKFLGCERISIMLLDDEAHYLVIRRAIGVTALSEESKRIRVGEGIAGRVFSEGKLMVINDMESSGLQKRYSQYDAFLSIPFICAPLEGHNVKLGVINITNKLGNKPFTEEDVDIINYISHTASIAVNNYINEMRVKDSLLGTVKSLAEAVEAKDPYTRGHSDRVSKLSVGIALEMGLSREEIRVLKFAGILHDAGKIGIPEYVLSKPGKLNDEEFEMIKKHPVIGENILRDIKFLETARAIIRHHHERIDGRGYPDGLKGEEIPLGARILAVADTFDAMNSDRPYRERLDYEFILKELGNARGKQLDSDCVNSLFKYLEEVRTTYGTSNFIR